MKRMNIPRALACALLCMLLLAAPFAVRAAGGSASFSIASVMLNSQGQFQPAANFDVTTESGSTVYLPISISSTKKVGGLAFTLEYDKEVLEFLPGSSISVFAEETVSFSARTTDSGVMVFWELNSASMNGVVYYAAFRVKEIQASTSTTVTLKLNQLFEANSTQDDISFSSQSRDVTVYLQASVLSTSDIAPFEKLETVSYPASASDIAAANAAFAELTDYQKEQLKKLYPDAYNWYATAQSRYNRLADAAAQQAVEDEMAAFELAHKDVLTLTPETVTADKAAAVKAASDGFSALSDRAKVLMEKKYKERLENLMTAIEDTLESQNEVKNFNEKYSNLYNLDEATIEDDPTSYATLLDEALMVYGSLTDAAKASLKEHADHFTAMRAYCDEVVEKDAAQAALMAEVSDFQGQWTDVLLLNQFTVSQGDETAIRLALVAYERLSDGAKDLLAGRINNLEGLLAVIENMQGEQPSGTVTVPVIIPGATETVVVENENSVEVYKTKTNPVFLVVLAILLVITLISFALPFILGVFGKKKSPKPTVKEETHE